MFEQEVESLRIKRETVARLEAEVDALRQDWEKDHQPTLEALASAKRQLAELDHALRAQVVAQYLATGLKSPHPGLGIRVSEVPVYDEQDALGYVQIYAPKLLRFDKKGFEKLAKGVRDVADIEFVVWEEKVIATIAKVL